MRKAEKYREASHYEDLRQGVIKETWASTSGLAVFLRMGMAHWIQVIASGVPVLRVREATSPRAVAKEARGSIIQLLTDMALSAGTVFHKGV